MEMENITVTADERGFRVEVPGRVRVTFEDLCDQPDLPGLSEHELLDLKLMVASTIMTWRSMLQTPATLCLGSLMVERNMEILELMRPIIGAALAGLADEMTALTLAAIAQDRLDATGQRPDFSGDHPTII